MANEYAVNQSDLTSVANAIREKGETSEQLVFPSGFVTAIQDITVGADLNFEVVGGTSRPSSPNPNTIWINTSTAITEWAFSAEEPASPVPGMVWIGVSNTSGVSFNALKDSTLYVYPIDAKQYTGSKWENVNAESYQGGAWVEWILSKALYYKGDERTGVTGGWQTRAVGASTGGWKLADPSLTKNSDHMLIGMTSVERNGIVEMANGVPMDGYSTIRFKMTRTIPTDDGYMNYVAVYTPGSNPVENYAAKKVITTGTDDVLLPISNLTAGVLYNVCIGVARNMNTGPSITVSEILRE